MEKFVTDTFKSEITKILNREKDALKNSNLIERMPETVDFLFEQKKERIAEKLIGALGDSLLNEESAARMDIAGALFHIGKNLMAHRQYKIMLRLSYKLIHWIKLESFITPVYKDVSIQLKDLACILIRNQQDFESCDHIVETFNLIYRGKLPKDKAIRDLAYHILKEIGTGEILTPLLKEFQTDEENKRWQATRRLIQLGTASAEPLLNLLRESPDRHERSRILRIISSIGSVAIPYLKDEITKEGTWYYIRNLVLLFGKVGNKSHLNILEPFLKHGDIRVQREALKSICHIGEKEGEEIILSILPFADDRLKLDIVEILGKSGNDEAVPFLLELLKSSLAASSNLGYELAEKICKSLGDIGMKEAIPLLTDVLDSSLFHSFASASPHSPDPVWERQEETLHKIKATAASALAIIKGKKKNDDEANDMIFDKPQNNHELLNKKISLSDDPEHLQRWADFYSRLTTEESNAMYHVLKEGISREDCIIYKQGEPNRRLYFVEEGKLVLAYDQDGEEIWIKTLKAGDVAGVNSFFTNTICTTSMITISDVRIKFLEKNDLLRLKERFQDFESKLKTYSFQFENILDVLKQYGMERRANQRLLLSGRISAALLDASGKPDGKTYRGHILDVSSGGLSFQVQSPNENLKQFLNRKINLKFMLIGNHSHQEIDKDGIIVAIHDKTADHYYSVHVKFDEPLMQYSLIRSGEFKIAGASSKGLVIKKDIFLVTELPPD